jgi:hypothetical protein
MGRPPIGKTAMTNAKRQQRHRDRVRARSSKPAPKGRASPAVVAPDVTSQVRPPARAREGHCFLCRRPVEKVEGLIAIKGDDFPTLWFCNHCINRLKQKSDELIVAASAPAGA